MKLVGTIASQSGREKQQRHPNEILLSGEYHNTCWMEAYLDRVDSQATPIRA